MYKFRIATIILMCSSAAFALDPPSGWTSEVWPAAGNSPRSVYTGVVYYCYSTNTFWDESKVVSVTNQTYKMVWQIDLYNALREKLYCVFGTRYGFPLLNKPRWIFSRYELLNFKEWTIKGGLRDLLDVYVIPEALSTNKTVDAWIQANLYTLDEIITCDGTQEVKRFYRPSDFNSPMLITTAYIVDATRGYIGGTNLFEWVESGDYIKRAFNETGGLDALKAILSKMSVTYKPIQQLDDAKPFGGGWSYSNWPVNVGETWTHRKDSGGISETVINDAGGSVTNTCSATFSDTRASSFVTNGVLDKFKRAYYLITAGERHSYAFITGSDMYGPYTYWFDESCSYSNKAATVLQEYSLSATSLVNFIGCEVDFYVNVTFSETISGQSGPIGKTEITTHSGDADLFVGGLCHVIGISATPTNTCVGYEITGDPFYYQIVDTEALSVASVGSVVTLEWTPNPDLATPPYAIILKDSLVDEFEYAELSSADYWYDIATDWDGFYILKWNTSFNE